MTGLYLCAATILAAALIIWLNINGFKADRDGTWHSHPFRMYKMRRYVNGAWQVRDMASAELDKDQEARTL